MNSKTISNSGQARTLSDQVALVTGASTGIGREVAITLAKRGATVVCAALEESTETVAEIERDGGRATSFVADLTDEQQVEDLFLKVLSEHKRIDILVNNAGYYVFERRPFWEIDLAEWEKFIKINIRTVFLCSKAASKSMREARSGRIVNMTSNVITTGMPNAMHYVAAKGAVAAMTRAMSNELGEYGIAVNSVAPGLVATETALESISTDDFDYVLNNLQAIKQQLVATDVAEAVSFLAGPEARLISGQMLLVNGGGV